jgi:predicted nucleic acid-binding protein
MPIVVDASIVVAPVLEESEPKADLLLARRDEWVVPALWWFELRNALVINERRRRITDERTALFLGNIARLPVAIDRLPDETAVMTLARQHRLTVYDAAYLELALRERLPLATLDASLAAAARQEGVAVLGDSGV